ncbi:PP0621 family protein [Pigmentiphaga soli]|uniref:PP0621 family protein n=1 Tax=Pigmentiphaga soli TaxID=1007095 RepID=A0ABP8GU17_9BURK
MGKILFWLIVILVALLAARIAARNAANAQLRRQDRRRPRPDAAPQAMVQCAHCGVHLPASEAVRRRGYNYCGLAHSLRGPAR